MKKFNKITNYKISIQNSILFPILFSIPRKTKTKNEIKKKILFTIALKRIKVVGLTLIDFKTCYNAKVIKKV